MTVEPRPLPRTPFAALNEALGERARATQLRIAEKMSRADVRDLAAAIDEAIVWAVGSHARHVAEFAAQREADLRLLVAARKEAAQ
jgi:hypothetical protein